MINTLFPRNFVVSLYALFPPIFLSWKVVSANFPAFWMYVWSHTLQIAEPPPSAHNTKLSSKLSSDPGRVWQLLISAMETYTKAHFRQDKISLIHMADKCLEGCLMIFLHQYTPLLLGACLIHALQSVPTLEKWQARSKIYCCCQVSGTFSTHHIQRQRCQQGSFLHHQEGRQAGSWTGSPAPLWWS